MEAKTISQREREILETIFEFSKKYLNPGRIILFGSRGKGRFYKNSDFDLAVDKEKPDIRIERMILEAIDKVAGLYEADIVYLGSVDKAFKDIVLESGEVIYEKGN